MVFKAYLSNKLMISSLVGWETELSSSHSLFAHSTIPNKLKINFYGLFSSIFKPKYSQKINVKHQIFYEILINTIFTLQAISLAWYPKMNITDWAAYEEVWKILGFISYDSVCADLNIINFCFFGTGLLIAAEMVFIVIFGYFKYLNKKPSAIFSFLTRKIALLLTTFCMIPSMNIMLAALKYSLINADKIAEYNRKIATGDINYGYIGIIIPILAILILITLNFLSEVFSCDMKHSHYKKNIKARSSSELDLQTKFFYVILCIFYFSFGDSYAISYQISSLVISLYLLAKCTICLPYFNMIENSIKASAFAMISLNLSNFLFGRALDNSMIILVFSIFLQPLILFISIKFVFSQYKNLSKSKNIIKNQFNFERKFRNLLINSRNEEKNNTLNLFKNFWKSSLFQKDKIFIIWEFNFCRSGVKDERLARIKFSKIKKANASLEGEIQEWRIFNWLNRKVKQFPEYEFLLFLKEFNRIKLKDEDLCNVLIELQGEFGSRAPRIQKLINLVNRAALGIDEIKEGYQKIILRHKNVEAYEYYASFLEGIMNNAEEANLIKRGKNWIDRHSELNEHQSLEKCSRDMGILLISCEESDFGTIAYINHKAEQILKISAESAYGTSLSNFIPQPFNATHTNLMRTFFKECESTEIFSHENLFLQTNDGFLVECQMVIKLTALDSSAYFLISFKPRPPTRQIALISQENIVLSHSENFMQFFQKSIKYAHNKQLQEILAKVNIHNIQDNASLIFNINGKEILLLRITKTIKSTPFHVLLIIYDRNEIQKWRQGEAQEQLGNFENLGVNNQIPNWRFFNKRDSNGYLFSIDREESRIKEINILESPDNLIEENKTENQSGVESKLSSLRMRNSKKANIGKLLLLNLKKKIRIFQWALFIIVRKT
ncbi:unnamed protein product [Blepharisma stoltei]|uniref:PAS domain-containing protein n=1 Tax=Blepharisma stoltei TaxID=1481888 RepID=A0AAU9IUG3_9CILI|nr:unnamed protein product [Blepharisma stoltei]